MRPQRTLHERAPRDPGDPTAGTDTVVFDRDRPMYACPRCGSTSVPTDDCVPDLVVEHECDRRGTHQLD